MGMDKVSVLPNRPERAVATPLGLATFRLSDWLKKQPQDGVTLFLDHLVMPVLRNSTPCGHVFEALMVLANVQTTTSQASAQSSAPFVVRVLIALALLPAAESLRCFLFFR
jgi:hypothetical protein